MLARLQVLAAAVLLSTGGAAIKSAALSAMEVAALRSAIAVFVLLLATPARHRLRDPRAAAVGAAIAMTMILYVAANKLTTAANTIFLQYAGPLYVLLAAPSLLGENIRRRDLPHIAAVAAGLSLFFVDLQEPSATAPRPALGNLLATLSGVSWAATIMGLRWLAARASAACEGTETVAGSAEAAAIFGNAFVFIAGLPWILASGQPAAADWAVVAYLGVFQVGVAYILFSAGVRRVPAPEASLLLLIEPALNPVWAWMIHREQPGAWAVAGGGLILASTAVNTVLSVRKRA